ncbi:hypothetical protein OPV22_029781 [Ensete ventricosum]|uniref:Uncharacterized protein n=1 Tax=Ensete ventricosum TaxID=4639 RepID=A0AAV8QEL3_ENSVE|nr:hypothetical protein OPV22_029781 [Ensete ventricosum]
MAGAAPVTPVPVAFRELRALLVIAREDAEGTVLIFTPSACTRITPPAIATVSSFCRLPGKDDRFLVKVSVMDLILHEENKNKKGELMQLL